MDSSAHAPRPRPAFGAAWRIALIYAVVSASWIFGSDLLLQSLLSDSTAERLTHYQTVKGLFFVFTTAALIFFLVRDALSRIHNWQEALAESEARFRRMVEWSPIGIFVNVEGRFRYVNHAMQVLLGATEPEQLLGRPVLDFIHSDYHLAVKQRIRMLLEQRIAVPLIEERFRRLDGSYVWVEVTALPLEYEDMPACQVMVHDIHAKRQAEAQLRQLNETLERRVAVRTSELQQANEDLRTFSFSLSHDLRVPLRSITRFAEQVLQTDVNSAGSGIHDAARRIVAAAARLDRLIKDLFEYNQVARTEIRLRRVGLALVVNEVAGLLRREPEFANVQLNIREPMPWVLAHRPTLALVLQNLVYNAAKFVSPSITPVVTISAQSSEGMVRLIVEDNGVGIQPERAQTIFDVFERSTDDDEDLPASGIGLAVVRRGVERMGGRVGVESIPGAGSRFWIQLRQDPESPA